MDLSPLLKGTFSDKAFLIVAEFEGNGIGGGDTEDNNQYNGPDKPRTKPSKKKKKVY